MGNNTNIEWRNPIDRAFAVEQPLDGKTPQLPAMQVILITRWRARAERFRNAANVARQDGGMELAHSLDQAALDWERAARELETA